MNNRIPTLALVIFGLLFTSLLTRNGGLAWMALPFLLYLGMGVLLSPSPSKVRLDARRSVEKDVPDGVPSIEVSVTIKNNGGPVNQLYLADPSQTGMHITDGAIRQLAALGENEEVTFKYTFESKRGSFSWKTAQVVVNDPFSLIEAQIELPAEAEIQVQPHVKKLRPFRLWPQRTLHSAGSIPARLGGSGTDFWGVREYHTGDPLRRLDWRMTARHPRQFFTKEFEQEEIADIGLILDARRKTDLQVGESSLFEYSVGAVASLAEMFLRQGNRVSLLVYGQYNVNLFPGYGKVQLHRILSTLARVTTEAGGTLESLLYLPVQMFSSHSLIIILSPLASNDWPLFPRLRAYGYQVLLISPNPVDYVQRMLPDDPVTQLANRLTGIERRLEIRKISQLWVPVIDWKVSQPLAPLVRNALSRIHIQQER